MKSESANSTNDRRRPSPEELLGITKQERVVVEAASNGLTDKEIARDRGITISSVRTYWDRLREKLKAHSRTHVVAIVTQAMLRESEQALEDCEQELSSKNGHMKQAGQ